MLSILLFVSLVSAARDIADRYIAVLHPHVDLSSHLDSFSSLNITHTYSFPGFQAYAAHLPDKADVSSLQSHPEIATLHEDQLYTSSALVQQSPVVYALDQISHLPSSSPRKQYTYTYNSPAGSGTFAYILDSGISTGHSEFGGRASNIHNSVKGTPEYDTDGHGTSVAAIVGGRTYGVAKDTKILGVKITDHDEGLGSEVLDGFNWAVNDILSHRRAAKSVINLSISADKPGPLDEAIDHAAAQGILTIVGAGNKGSDARNKSPGSAKRAVVVSATDRTYKRPAWANWGPGVKIFAPGVGVTSAWIGGKNAAKTLSGTSQASGYVSGIALYLKGKGGGSVLGLGTKGIVKDPKGGANVFAYNGAGK